MAATSGACRAYGARFASTVTLSLSAQIVMCWTVYKASDHGPLFALNVANAETGTKYSQLLSAVSSLSLQLPEDLTKVTGLFANNELSKNIGTSASVSKTVSQSVSQSASPSVGPSVSQSVCPSVRQSVGSLVGPSASQSVRADCQRVFQVLKQQLFQVEVSLVVVDEPSFVRQSMHIVGLLFERAIWNNWGPHLSRHANNLPWRSRLLFFGLKESIADSTSAMLLKAYILPAKHTDPKKGPTTDCSINWC